MSHRIIAVIECNHISPEGVACKDHRLMWKTSGYATHAAQARVARRIMEDEKSGWQLGIVGTFHGVPLHTLDFCPEHRVETEEPYEGGRPRYDLALIPDLKKEEA